ncbi:MAG: hypothetical protein MUO82_10000 [Candidatus Thermoplasmatota archaeon]|nr:hypothetical protein [Candidatus Thermoplasmatota archaeon]
MSEKETHKSLAKIRAGYSVTYKDMARKLDDRYSQTMTFDSDCGKCKHLKGEGYCKAYPDGIPMDIWTAKRKHDKPIPGDQGIQFEPLE